MKYVYVTNKIGKVLCLQYVLSGNYFVFLWNNCAYINMVVTDAMSLPPD